jgi:hypothetical protein
MIRVPSLTFCLVVASALLVPQGAQAAPSITLGVLLAQTSFAETGPATCTVGDAGDNDNDNFTLNGPTKTSSVSSTTTIVDNGDATDTSTVKASSKTTAKATRKGGTLQVSWQTLQTQSISSAQGLATDCDPSVTTMGYMVTQVNLTEDSWLSLAAELSGGTVLTAVVNGATPGGDPIVEQIVFVGGHTDNDFRFFLPAGTFTITAVTQGILPPPQTGADPTSTVQRSSGIASFVPAGTAIGKAAGTGGGSYLKTKGEVKCGDDSLSAKWKKAAGKGDDRAVKKATFSVNGHKVETVNHPKAGQTTKLKNLDTDEDVNLKVKMKLAGGGSATLTRSYLSCS